MKESIKISIKFIPIVLFWLLLNYHRDSVFPFSLNSSQSILIAYSTIFFIVLMTLFILVFKLMDKEIKLSEFQFKILIASIITTCFAVLEFSLFRLYSSEKDLFINKSFENLIFLHFCLSLVICILVFFKNKISIKVLVFLMTVVASLISISTIWFIPNTAKLGDLMPILESQGNATLNGESIYQYFKLDNNVKTQAVRQPGMHLLYLPALILDFDIRIMNVIYFALIVFILYKILKNKVNNHELILGLTLLIFFPYRLARVDYYDVPYILILLSSVYLLTKLLTQTANSRELRADSLKAKNREHKTERSRQARPDISEMRNTTHETRNPEHRTPNTEHLHIHNSSFIIHNLLWGIGISMQVWNWLFSPFIWLFMWKKLGFKIAFLSAAMSLITALIIMLPFILPSPENYYEHVFGFYDKVRNSGIKAETSIHLSPLLNYFVSSSYFTKLQVLIVGIIGILAIKFMRNFQDLIFFCGLAFFGFMSLNTHTWPYMFILIFVMMIICVKPNVSN